jgi:hypothetical protein
MNTLRKRILLIALFLIAVSIQISYIASAEEQFGISLNCVDSCNGNKNWDYSKDILFELTIKNNLDYWVVIEGSRDGVSMRLTVENIRLPNNGKDYPTYYILGQSFFIKPKDEVKVYIPFDLYNKIDKDSRIGDWKIYPELLFSNIKFYKVPYESKETPLYTNSRQPFTINSPIKANVLEFKTTKPEVEVQADKSNIIPKDFWENPFNDKLLFPLIVLVIGSILVYYFTNKR